MTNTLVSSYESQVRKFKPEPDLVAKNSNDVRVFVFDWFTHFEHASAVDYYLGHLDTNMTLSFPGQDPMTTHSEFTKWYNNLLAQTLWNFHDVSRLQIRKTATREYLVSFIFDWYGEVKATSDQAASWQSRKDSFLYHYNLRQTWTVKEVDHQLVIKELRVTGGGTPSPIIE